MNSKKAKNNSIENFLNNNSNKEVVVVQGLGFVGSVMSIVCANALKGDFAVIGVELPNNNGRKIIKSLNNGKFPLSAEDPKIDEFYNRSIIKGNFFATNDTNAYKFADIIIVDVNLDVNKVNDKFGKLDKYNVDISPFKKAIKVIGQNCKEDALILVETTVPPGSCEKIVKPIILGELKKRKLSLDKIKIGHSYERVMPGPDYIDSIQNFYRVYSGINSKSCKAVKSFLKKIIRTDQYPLTKLGSTTASEMAKVLENSYRAMNISFMVEWSRYAEEAGVNLYEVIDSIRLRPTHSNLMYPGVGVGGYCLTKDALLASWSREILLDSKRTLKQSESAISINDQMPRFAFQFIKSHYPNLNTLKILLLGISYRGDVGDTRYSPVERLYNYLSKECKSITCHDPYVSYWEEKSLKIEKNIKPLFKKDYGMIIISAGHSIYNRNKTIKMINEMKPLIIIDTIGLLKNDQINLLNVKHTLKILGRGDI